MSRANLAPYAKAVIAFLVPGVVALQTAMNDSSPGGSAITPNEWIGAGLLCVATSGLVWAVPNSKDKPSDPGPAAPAATVLPAPVVVTVPAVQPVPLDLASTQS